jgi:hypothetical protein
VSGSFTGPFATEWKPAVSRGLGNGEVVAIFKVAVLGTSILPKVVIVSVT